MSQLRFPLKDHLQDPVTEVAIHRIAEELDSRRRGRKRRRFVPLPLLGVTAAAAAFVALPHWYRRDAGPLRFADGQDLVAMDAGGAAKEIALSDGSHILLSPGARVEPLRSSGSAFSAIVTQGRAEFGVRPGGPRHWTVECGLATVEVLGTRFTCEREPGRLRVAVGHGVVLVRGDHVPERVRRLSAGEALDLAEEKPRPTPIATVLPESPTDRSDEEDAAAPKRGAMARGAWRALARRGHHAEAFAALGSEGLRRESKRLGVADLLALADVARLSGHPAEAVLPLERILDEYSHDAQAPLAAFALGRLELDSLGHAQAAASAFRRALALDIPHSLREDVRARLVEACARSGDAAATQRAAEAYLAEFPEGRHRRAVERWLRLR
jgi:transmembrane sensor